VIQRSRTEGGRRTQRSGAAEDDYNDRINKHRRVSNCTPWTTGRSNGNRESSTTTAATNQWPCGCDGDSFAVTADRRGTRDINFIDFHALRGRVLV